LVSVTTDGPSAGLKNIQYIDTFDPQTQFRFVSNGVPLVVFIDQLPMFRGAIDDYRDSVYGAGFAIRLANE
jgi:hypothetical protein